MPTVSVSDVQSLTGSSLPETIIQYQIDMVISRSGDCLDSNYSETEANLIALYASCAMTDLLDPSTKVKTERAANGASTTYQDRTFSASSFDNSQFGSMARMLDTNGCLNALFPSTVGFRLSGQQLGDL